MIVVGALLLLSSTAAGTLVAWQNRAAVIHVKVGDWVWTGRLYALLIIGALLACWFLLGAAFIQCRIAERRGKRAAHRAAVDATPATRTAAPSTRTAGATPSRRMAGAGLPR